MGMTRHKYTCKECGEIFYHASLARSHVHQHSHPKGYKAADNTYKKYFDVVRVKPIGGN